jgi:hypothetical protein
MKLASAVIITPCKNPIVEGHDTGVERTEVGIPRGVLATLEAKGSIVILERHGREEVVDRHENHHHKGNGCARSSTSIA